MRCGYEPLASIYKDAQIPATSSCCSPNLNSTLHHPVIMVKLAFSLVALATAASAVAVPAATSGTTFSFSQWVEDIIANPDTALTPDEAIAAAKAAAGVGSLGGLEKRAWCDAVGSGRANVCHPSGCASVRSTPC